MVDECQWIVRQTASLTYISKVTKVVICDFGTSQIDPCVVILHLASSLFIRSRLPTTRTKRAY